jgi:hypothetical protein
MEITRPAINRTTRCRNYHGSSQRYSLSYLLTEAIQGNEPETVESPKVQPETETEDPAAMKRDLPGQDPGTAYQPQGWSGKISRRG